MRHRWMLFLLAALATAGCNGQSGSPELLNVSYDPTRELWREINQQFAAAHGEVGIRQSHGGSSTQARAVIDGLEADVVTLATWPDTDAIRRAGLIAEGWETRLPELSLPYLSTIVFVVREGNPKNVQDWPDLARDGVQIITPNPKTSGNGKLSFLAAWGSVVLSGGTEQDAERFVTAIYQATPVLDTGARAATTTFAQKNIGDVHLTWENEAHLEVAESKGKLQIVYPKMSIRAEPHVAVVDANVDRKGTRALAEAYLKYLYTDEAQRIIGKNHYRPTNPSILKEFSAEFPDMRLFSIGEISSGWDAAHDRFFAEGALFDQIFAARKQ